MAHHSIMTVHILPAKGAPEGVEANGSRRFLYRYATTPPNSRLCELAHVSDIESVLVSTDDTEQLCEGEE